MVVCKFFQQGYCKFGQNCRNEHVYASKYSYRAPQTHTTRTGQESFNSNTTRHSFNNSNASSLFRNAMQNTSAFQNPSGSSVFAQNPATKASVFDRLEPQQNQAKSIFAQANQSSFGSAQPNVFQVQNQVEAKTLFAQTNQNIFGQSQANFNQSQSVAASVFATANQNIPNDPFKQRNTPFINKGNVFHIHNNQISSNTFGVAVEQTVEDSVYSKMEDLSKSDIEAFESVDFKLGFIPEIPPPRTLCV